MAGTYYGKVCAKHPELNGLRRRNNRGCAACDRAKKREWAKTGRNRDPAMTMVYSRLRKAKMDNACPKWADRDAIAAIYASRSAGQAVDHIIPLKGIHPVTKLHVVCGLHVDNNLRVADAKDNGSKWAWFDPALHEWDASK